MNHSALIIMTNDERETILEFMPEYEKNCNYPHQNQTTTDYDGAATSHSIHND
jgi:hypothetical protein